MDGKKQHLQMKDFKDPFNAGQMVGMLVMLTFLENNQNIPPAALDKLRWTCATNAEAFLEKPAEDIFMLIDNLVKDIQI